MGTDPNLQLEVERLHARYAHALDDDRLEEWPQFFTDNGRYRVTTAENEERGLPLSVLYADGRAMMRDRIQSLRHANIYEPQHYRHLVSSVLV
jgi:anthranilate 1,2-dioxygenase small subunit